MKILITALLGGVPDPRYREALVAHFDGLQPQLVFSDIICNGTLVTAEVSWGEGLSAGMCVAIFRNALQMESRMTVTSLSCCSLQDSLPTTQ